MILSYLDQLAASFDIRSAVTDIHKICLILADKAYDESRRHTPALFKLSCRRKYRPIDFIDTLFEKIAQLIKICRLRQIFLTNKISNTGNRHPAGIFT